MRIKIMMEQENANFLALPNNIQLEFFYENFKLNIFQG